MERALDNVGTNSKNSHKKEVLTTTKWFKQVCKALAANKIHNYWRQCMLEDAITAPETGINAPNAEGEPVQQINCLAALHNRMSIFKILNPENKDDYI